MCEQISKEINDTDKSNYYIYIYQTGYCTIETKTE